jgi:hypothetical protein
LIGLLLTKEIDVKLRRNKALVSKIGFASAFFSKQYLLCEYSISTQIDAQKEVRELTQIYEVEVKLESIYGPRQNKRTLRLHVEARSKVEAGKIAQAYCSKMYPEWESRVLKIKTLDPKDTNQLYIISGPIDNRVYYP